MLYTMNQAKCYLILSIVSFGIASIESIQCRSYGQQVGKCVEITKCPSILREIQRPNKTTEDILRLQKLTCITQSHPNRDPVVCCPLSEILISPSDIGTEAYFGSTSRSTQLQTPTRTTTPFPWNNGSRRTRIPPLLVTFPTRRSVSTTTPTSISLQTERVGEDRKRLHLHQKFLDNIPPLDNCSVAGVTNKIVGGKESIHGQYPHMARLGYKNLRTGKIEYYCGGSIISKRYVLTAAHCTYGYDDNFELVHVRLAEHNTKQLSDCSFELQTCSIPEDVKVEKVITHKSYNTVSKHNDISLIRLERDVSFESYFKKPVCLPFFKEYNIDPKPVSNISVVIGYGRVNWTQSEGSDILQYVHLPIVEKETCVAKFRNRVVLGPGQICAGGEKNQDSCGGDSGGPLMMDNIIGERGVFPLTKTFQYGIVSFGPVKCGSGIPGVYTYLVEYLDWILENMES